MDYKCVNTMIQIDTHQTQMMFQGPSPRQEEAASQKEVHDGLAVAEFLPPVEGYYYFLNSYSAATETIDAGKDSVLQPSYCLESMHKAPSDLMLTDCDPPVV